MLSEEQVIEKLKKRINATLQQIGDSMITGGVDSMEKIQIYVRTGSSLSNNSTGNL